MSNTIDWGKIHYSSWSPETNLTGTASTPSYQNQYSFSFDGVDDYIKSATTYSELDGQTKATFSFWIKPISIPNYKIIASVIKNATVSNHQFQIELTTAGTLQFSIDSTSKYIRASSTPINVNVWTHVMYCIDTTQGVGSQRGKVFINGVDSTSATSVSGTFSSATGPLYIGEKQSGQYNPFLGNIDEFAIWSGTDLRNDVATIYNNGVPNDLNNIGLSRNPTTWYRMGENATWDGREWNPIEDVQGSNNALGVNMAEENRVTDVPT